MARIDTESVSIAVPVDILALLDDLCNRKDLNRTQVVVRSIKAYLALDAAKDCSLFVILNEALEERQTLKNIKK